MSWILLLACGEPEDTGGPEVEEEEKGIDLVFSVDTVDFGSVELGSSGLQSLTITNKGDATAFLAEMGADDELVEVTAPGVLTIEPNRIANVDLSWTPETPGLLSTNAWFRAGSSPTNLEDHSIVVTGTADGPMATYSHTSADLGTVTVGCTETERIEVLNIGTLPLVIDDLTLDYAPEFEIVSEELPITIGANESTLIELVYTPVETQTTVTTLYITTNDPFAPQTTIPAEANGWIEADNEMYFEVTKRQPLTILMNINEIAIYQTHASKLEASIETFFLYLDEFDVEFRMACFLHENGTQVSEVLYIDETYDSEDSVDVFYDMLGGSSQYGDNDSNLQTLDNALNNSMDWLFEGVYADSKLNFFAINDDADTSPISPSVYVSEWQALKDDDEDVQVHAIGGTATGSCGSVQFRNFEDAVDETGGTFLDICASDWVSHMETIAEAFIGDIQQFELEGNPAASTIEIYWDGIPQLTGWEFDSSQNEVVFESTSYPPDGTTLRIYYIMATECPE